MKDSLNKIALFLKNQKVQYLLSFCLFILLAVFGYIHATKGIDLTDEGMYLSTAMRFSMGDIPFRDEFMSILTQFNVLLSPVFMLYPDISLLHMRYLGLMLHAVSFFVLFLLLSRYGPPFFVALACSGIFFSNVFIMSPSYNNFSRDFSMIAMVFWLFSCLSPRRSVRILFSILGGFFFTLIVLSYSPMFAVIFVPLAVAGICYFSSKRCQSFFQPTVIFAGTFVTLMLFMLITITSLGFLPDFIQEFLKGAGTTELASKGLWLKVYNIGKDFFHVAPEGLKLSGIFIIAFLFLAIQRGKRGFDLVCSIIAIMIAVSSLVLFFSHPIETSYRPLILSFTLILGISGFFLNDRQESTSRSGATWKMVRNCALSWGLTSAFIYGVSSSNGFRQCIYGIAPIFVVGMIALYRFVESRFAQSTDISIRKTMWPVVFIGISFTFIIAGLNFNYHFIYREAKVEKLTSRFKHPRLTGIYSTPEKVMALEELLSYLGGKVKPNDYFLCYNYIPMLYFLTHTRPSYGAAWAMEQWPVSIRERLVKKMLDEKKIPEYCIRMMAFPGRSWRRPDRRTSYTEDDPLNAFVMSNYYFEKIIYPFEIWHHGLGPNFRLFDQMEPDFESSFIHWKGADVISMRDLAKTAAPLGVQGFRGDFNFSRIPDKGGNIIRVSPFRKGKNGELLIQFGYTLEKNGFDLKLHPDQEVIFIISARCSDKKKIPANLFIQDKTEEWERNSVIISNTSWDQYIVSKKIRDGVTNVCFGINWKPESEKEWLEIKHARIFVEN